MKKIKFLSALLALITVLGVVASTMTVPVFAAEGDEAEAKAGNDAKTTEKAGEDPEGTPGEDPENPGEEEKIDYLNREYVTEEEMLADMEKRLTSGDLSLYVHPVTGVVAIKNEKTGQITTTNPYDIGTENIAESTKQTLMSQIIVSFTDQAANNATAVMNSYKDAAAKNQILIKNIKGGIRVEYSIGTVPTRRVVPRQIEKSRYEELIYANLSDEPALRFKGYYQLMDPNRDGLTDKDRELMYDKYPITEDYAIYVIAEDVNERELNKIESFIKVDCPDYTYEVMMEDYQLLGYVSTADKAPLFKLALEYKLTDTGVDVRLAANGIRYDEDSYILNYIDILPYFGATSSDMGGYIFIPDGSGAIIGNDTMGTSNISLSTSIYGSDYAYQTLDTIANQQQASLPVFGAVEVSEEKTITDKAIERVPSVFDEKFGYRLSSYKRSVLYEDVKYYNEGFAAFMTEGESLAKLIFEHNGAVHKYNSIRVRVLLKPTDSYNLAEAMSVGNNVMWTVVSKRKYMGSYRISYVLLTDEKRAEENGVEKYYTADYTGMAIAYRDYLIKNGYISMLGADEIKKDIPMYIEALGSIKTQDTFLTFPVTVNTPLTTFDDLKAVTDDLGENGITNINYRLNGFVNGGLVSTVPYKVKFVNKLGGNDGFKDFTKYASEKGIGVFTDFDIVYVHDTKAFDGFNYKKDAVKTIDNRYISKSEYDSTYQGFLRGTQTLISPASFEKLYEHFSDTYANLGGTGISVSTLGTDLNSDFNKKAPYNREESKEFVKRVLSEMSEKFSVMTDGGNSYVIPYADHILNVSLDSSGYTFAAGTVPFFGIVFHGALNFAGEPTNMAGNYDYEVLKLIENGASPYYLIAYENTEKLKEDANFQKYFAVSYDIWREDIIKTYGLLNENMASLQDDTIVRHEFVLAERIAGEDEIEADKLEKELADAIAAQKDADALAVIERKVNFEARMAAKNEDTEFDAEAYRAELMKEYEKKKTQEETLGGGSKQYESVVDDPNFVFKEENITISPDGSTIYVLEDETIEIKTPVDGSAVYEQTKYTVSDNSVVKVTYSDGTAFYLNYNDFAVSVDGYELEAFSFKKI